MRRRTIALLAAAVAVVVALVVVVTAAAQGPSSLPPITVSELLNNVATKAQGTTAVSGDVAWSNGLLGGSSLLSLGGTQTPGGLSSLLTGGSGRVWAQDGKVRLESQGQNGDFVVVGNGATVWTWDSMTTTATQYTLPAHAGASTASPAPSPASSLDPATAISRLIAKLAPTATLSVDGQATVAGRQTYTLTLTPTSSLTSVGSVTVAIDGERWVPLQVQVFAKGDTTRGALGGLQDGLVRAQRRQPVHLHAAERRHHRPQDREGARSQGHGRQRRGRQGRAAQAPDPGAGQGAGPVPARRRRRPRRASSSAALSSRRPRARAPRAPAAGLTPAQRKALASFGKHPTAVLAYGTGFGTVVVVESRTTAAQDAQIAQGLGQVSMIGKATVNGAPAVRLQTSLGSVVTFRQGDVRVVVAGLVPWSVVDQVAGSLH